ncbi:MFS transporter [Catenulispora subtropica]|uniref:Major facilitator superfamily MFS_1 n=1 Tax=Catenulispora subtropica TaxID=450798 RepID=A0ABN2RBA6_9ACTN
MKSAKPPIPASIIPVALVTQVAVSMVQQGLPSISIPLQRDLHVGLAGLGLVLGAANAATAASVYAWGRWSDRVGDRRVLLAGLSVAVPGLVAAGGAASSEYRAWTIAGLSVAGVGVGAGTAALARALADRVPGRRLGLVLGLRQAAVPVGGLVAAALLPAAVGMAGVGAAFDVLGLACIVAGLGVAFGLPATPRPVPPSDAAAIAEAPAIPAGRLAGLPTLLAANACYCVAQTGAVALSVAAWHTAIGIGVTPAVIMFVAVQSFSGVLRIGLGRFGDRRPDQEPAVLIVLGACTATLLTMLALAHIARVPAALQAGLLMAACLPAGGWNGLAFAVSTRLAVRSGNRHRLGRIHGLQNTVLFTAVGLTPPALTAVTASAGWTACWALLAAGAAAGALIHALSSASFARPVPPSTARQEPLACASPAPTTSS